jgi:hypothetical protein
MFFVFLRLPWTSGSAYPDGGGMGLPLTVEQMERLPSFDREWRSLAPEERDLINRALRRAQLVPRLATRRTVSRRFGRWR